MRQICTLSAHNARAFNGIQRSMAIHELDGKAPRLGADARVADIAEAIGDVTPLGNSLDSGFVAT